MSAARRSSDEDAGGVARVAVPEGHERRAGTTAGGADAPRQADRTEYEKVLRDPAAIHLGEASDRPLGERADGFCGQGTVGVGVRVDVQVQDLAGVLTMRIAE